MSNIVIDVNGNSAGDGFLIAPDNGSTFPVPLHLRTNDGTTVSATVDATPNGAGVSLPGGTVSIGPAGLDIPIHATQASSARGDTVINVHVAGVTTSFALTAISNPQVWFRGRFEARFATDDDWYNDPKGTWGAGNDGVNPLGNGNEGPGWTWVLEGEPNFAPADGVATDPNKPVGRVIRYNNPVALRSHAPPVVTTVNEIHGSLANATTQVFTAGDPIIGAAVNLGPNSYFASNDPAHSPPDPAPAETYPAGFEVMALFEFHIDNFFSGKSAALGDRPKANGFPNSPADERTAIGWVDLNTFNNQRLQQLQNDYAALPAADKPTLTANGNIVPGTGSAAGRNLARRIFHLTPANAGIPGVATLPQGWSGMEEYTGKVNDSLGFQPGTSSVIAYLAGYRGFTYFSRFFAFHSDELCGYDHGSLVADTTAKVIKDCVFITDRSTFGKDEIDAMLHVASPAVIPAAFYVEVDGFRPGDLGITAADLVGVPSVYPTITPAPGVMGMTIGDVNGKPSALLAVDPSLPNIPQRFTWVYPITFASTSGFIPGGQMVLLTASIGGVSGNAQIQLTEAANVYEVDGPVSWLSADTRVFMARAGEKWLNAPPLGTTLADASSFVKSIISNLNSGNSASPQNAGGFQTFDALPSGEDTSPLALFQTDHNNTTVFNFALARVRYRALTTPANNVRVFFRLCPALSVSVDYDPNTTYRRSPVLNSDGQPIPVLGVQAGNLVTIPFFAETRQNASVVSMQQQTDPANVQPIPPDATGAEVEAYFGCVLDINQPGQAYYPLNPVGNGPYSGSLKSILELVRNDHQCLLAEIAFDPDPITGNPSPATSDKLAQRNLSLVPSDNPGAVGSRRIPNTFELKATPLKLASGLAPDELLIDWGNTPPGSIARIYIPSVPASEILQLAGTLYSKHLLSLADASTIQCPAHGLTYMPIPPGTDVNHAGLLTVDLPAGVRHGQLFKIVVRQLSNASATIPRPRTPAARRGKAAVGRAAAVMPQIHWRRVRGSFQISIPVGTAKFLLEPEERRLSIFRYIEQSIPATDRWHAVFQRFVREIGDRVSGFGGDPGTVLPSPNGVWKHRPHPKHHEGGETRLGFTGKLTELVFDRFGDFDGFVLDTEDGKRRFAAREPDIERVASRAWSERILVTVYVEQNAPHRPERIVLHSPLRLAGIQ